MQGHDPADIARGREINAYLADLRRREEEARMRIEREAWERHNASLRAEFPQLYAEILLDEQKEREQQQQQEQREQKQPMFVSVRGVSSSYFTQLANEEKKRREQKHPQVEYDLVPFQPNITFRNHPIAALKRDPGDYAAYGAGGTYAYEGGEHKGDSKRPQEELVELAVRQQSWQPMQRSVPVESEEFTPDDPDLLERVAMRNSEYSIADERRGWDEHKREQNLRHPLEDALQMQAATGIQIPSGYASIGGIPFFRTRQLFDPTSMGETFRRRMQQQQPEEQEEFSAPSSSRASPVVNLLDFLPDPHGNGEFEFEPIASGDEGDVQHELLFAPDLYAEQYAHQQLLQQEHQAAAAQLLALHAADDDDLNELQDYMHSNEVNEYVGGLAEGDDGEEEGDFEEHEGER